jgi:hypothetical protein
MKMKPHSRLTPEEEAVIFQRIKENPRDRWIPIPVQAPRLHGRNKTDWSWKKVSER